MRFGYTLLYVRDVEETVGFYESVFGLCRKFVHEGGYGEMDTGPTKLGFVSHEVARASGLAYAEPDAQGPPPAVEIALVTEDVAAAYETAVKLGAHAVAPPKEKPWGQTVAYVRDLNGFLVEICSPMPE